MAQTTIGFDGNINEPLMAQIMTLVGAPAGVVAGPGDWLVSAVPGARQVAVNPGRGLKDFVVVAEDEPAILNVSAASSGGRWSLIVARRNWELNSLSFIPLVLPGDTPLASVGGPALRPLVRPRVLPPEFRDEPGVISDQKLAWVWTGHDSTDVLVWDLRRGPVKSSPIDGRELLLGSSMPLPFASIAVGTAGVPVPRGRTPSTVVMSVDVDVEEVTAVRVEAYGRWAARGNAAGSDWISIDNAQIGPARRAHNDGYASIPHPININVSAVLVPGRHTIALRSYAEPGGADRVVADSQVNVWATV